MANFLKIKTIAKQKGISLSDLAEQIEMTPTGLSLIIKSNKTMTDKIEAIARVLDVNVSVFFDDDSEQSLDNQKESELLLQMKEIIAQKDKIIAQQDKVIEILSRR